MTYRFPIFITSGLTIKKGAAPVWVNCFKGSAPTVDIGPSGLDTAPTIAETVANADPNLASGVYQFNHNIVASQGLFGWIDCGASNCDVTGSRYHFVDLTRDLTLQDIWEWAGGANSIVTPTTGHGTKTVGRTDGSTNTYDVADTGAERSQTRLT